VVSRDNVSLFCELIDAKNIDGDNPTWKSTVGNLSPRKVGSSRKPLEAILRLMIVEKMLSPLFPILLLITGQV